MFEPQRTIFRASADYQPLLALIGLNAEGVFTDPRILAWRKLPDRENCLLDAAPGATWRTPTVRLHIKRYFPARGSNGFITPAEEEVRGHRALVFENIPTAPLVGWGTLADGRSFTVFEDLAGYRPADKCIEAGLSFDSLLHGTAELAANLHNAGLHHRDLYLCHFMVSEAVGAAIDLRLIDTARVRRLPGFLTRRRWIVKDLAQFWYSTKKLKITDAQRQEWLERYAQKRRTGSISSLDRLRRSIEGKSRSIERHDYRLNRDRPSRNVSIPRNKDEG